MRLLAIIFLGLILSASADPGQTGQELFTAHCQTCHGPEGKGDGPAGLALDPPPRDLTKRPYSQGCGPGAIVHTLENGLEGTPMPSFEGVLSEEEMWKLARYVRSIQGGCCQD